MGSLTQYFKNYGSSPRALGLPFGRDFQAVHRKCKMEIMDIQNRRKIKYKNRDAPLLDFYQF
jgi:hypothetical protein